MKAFVQANIKAYRKAGRNQLGSMLNFLFAKVFNGNDSSISFSYVDSYDLVSDDFIIKGKFKGLLDNNNGFRTIVCSYSITDNKRSWFVGFDNGVLVFYMSSDGTSINTNKTSINVLDGNYHEVIIAKVKQEYSISIDGIFLNTSILGTIPVTLYSNSKPITIGSTSNIPVSLVFNGSIGDVIVSKQNGDIDLFLFAGQSNMTGYGGNQSLLPYNTARNQPHLFSYDTEAGNEIYTMLQPKSSTYFGSEIQFGYNAFKDNKNIAIVKVSEGGTGFGEGQWIKGGTLYNRLINAYFDTKIALETKGYNVKVRGLIFMQGENDTRTIDWANSYASNFNQFIIDLKSDLSLLSLPVVMGKIHDNLPTGGDGGRYDYAIEVREQQELLASQGMVTLFNTDDLELNPDSIHYSTLGQIELGNRFYNAARQYMTSTPFRPILKTKIGYSNTVTDMSINKNNGLAINVTTEKI